MVNSLYYIISIILESLLIPMYLDNSKIKSKKKVLAYSIKMMTIIFVIDFILVVIYTTKV